MSFWPGRISAGSGPARGPMPHNTGFDLFVIQQPAAPGKAAAAPSPANEVRPVTSSAEPDEFLPA